jgi:hypothetical protein
VDIVKLGIVTLVVVTPLTVDGVPGPLVCVASAAAHDGTQNLISKASAAGGITHKKRSARRSRSICVCIFVLIFVLRPVTIIETM